MPRTRARSRVNIILDAQRRVEDVQSRLSRLPLSDPRWDGTYSELQTALDARAAAEVRA